MSIKKSFKKSIAAFMALSIVYSNCYLCGLGISKVIAQEIKEPEIEVKLENSKYIEYKSEEYTGIAIQTSLGLSTNQEEDKYLPINSVQILLNLPELNGYFPQRANVVLSDTYLTTGEKNNDEINQNYDSNSGLLKVTYENTQAYSQYLEGMKDKFEIISIYPAEAYKESEEDITLQYTAEAIMSFAQGENLIATQKIENFTVQEKDNRGEILTFGITELKDEIYKGFMYSNVENGTDYDTKYKTVSTLCVLNSNVSQEIVLEEKENNFITNSEEENLVSSNGFVQYLATGIKRKEFDKILGTDGYIEFYQEEKVISSIRYMEVDDTKKLAIISSDGKVDFVSDEEETLIVEYPNSLTNLKIKLSPAIAEGFINFENQNVIKAAEDYGYELEKILGIKAVTSVNENVTNIDLLMLEPETKVSVTSSNVNFSTLQKSTTTLTIKLDDTDSSTKLFNSPIITVVLPEGLVGGNLSSPEIVNGNGLTIKSASADNNIITIELQGEQKTYDVTNVSGGTTIVMDIENMDFEDTTPTHTDKIEVNCVQGEEKIVASQDINIISKPGLLMLSTLSNYDDNNNVITIMNNKTEIVQIESKGQERQVVNTLDLINNYDEDLEEIRIIGRIGYSNEEVTSTFDTILTKPIELDIDNAEVYYSTNKDASYDDDTWINEFSSEAKAVKIVLEDSILAKANSIQIKEYVKLLKNIGTNQETYLNWDVEYSYKEINIQEDVVLGMVTPKDKLLANYNTTNQNVETSNGETIPVSLSITPVISQNYVHSGQLVTYRMSVRNNGQEDLENLTLISNIPENAIYTYYQEIEGANGNYQKLERDTNIKQKEWTIEKLEAGDTAEFEMMLTMADVQEEQEVVNSVSVIYNEQTISSISRILLKPANINVILTTGDEDIKNVIHKPGNKVYYYIKVTNILQETLKNVKVNYEIPECLTYIKGGITVFDEFEGYQIVEENGILNENLYEYNIDTLKPGEEKVILIVTEVEQLSNQYQEELVSISKVYLDDTIYESNYKTIKIKQPAFDISLEVDTKGKELLRKDDEIIYTIKAKNIGEISSIINVIDNIPEQLNILRLEYSNNKETATVIESPKQSIELVKLLNENDEVTIRIIAKVKNIEVLEDTVLEISNYATLKLGKLEINSNNVTVNIKPELIVEQEKPGDNEVQEPEEKPGDNEGQVPEERPGDNEVQKPEEKPNNNEGQVPEEKPGDNENQQPDDNTNNENKEEIMYWVSGEAWIDANSNGQKDNDEKLQHSVVVSLVDMLTGNFALDQNGNRIKTITDSEGKYTFNNIKEGTYIVLFEFDTNTYTVTTYKKEAVNDTLNSDVIISNVTIDGEKKLAAVTDKIEVNSNKENIDIGLIENATFDLSLNKEITKITVINSKGTESYEFEDGETAKVDLVAKYMNGANVIVNYRFTVQNEGEVAGYVNSLVDDLPTGLEFSSELNEDWYKGSDGKIYTTALSGTEIKPGEGISIELVLTKNMTEDNAGIFPNSASLEKISNLQNIQEKEETLENNQSSANLIISIKTGTVAMYAGITTICLVIICIGIYFIKKKVLNRGI